MSDGAASQFLRDDAQPLVAYRCLLSLGLWHMDQHGLEQLQVARSGGIPREAFSTSAGGGTHTASKCTVGGEAA